MPQGSYGVDRHAADLASVLDAVKVGKVLLVGHSKGGNIACRFYRSNPERVAGIIFVGSYVSGKQIDSIGNTLERIKAAVKMKLNRIGFHRQVGLPEEIAMETTKWPLYGINGNAESFVEFDASAELGDIAVPCLVVHGSADIVSPYDPCALGLIDALPDVEPELLQGVNHCSMVEDAPAANNRIAQFLEEKIIW